MKKVASKEADLVFFDRAIPDALCMLNDLGRLSMVNVEKRSTRRDRTSPDRSRVTRFQ
jgi:predicted ATPase